MQATLKNYRLNKPLNPKDDRTASLDFFGFFNYKNMGNFKNKLDNYQCVPRELIFDNRISDRARFVFVYMSSKPDNWSFFMQPMAKELCYSTETLRKYINELIGSGWLIKGEQSVNNSGTFGSVEYTLMDKLSDTENIGNGEIPTRKKPDTEKNRIGKNPTLIEIDYLNKDIIKEKIKEENKAFTPPSLEEVKFEFILKEFKLFNPISFFTFYESKNWYVGKNKMKNWKMAMAGWESREKEKTTIKNQINGITKNR